MVVMDGCDRRTFGLVGSIRALDGSWDHQIAVPVTPGVPCSCFAKNAKNIYGDQNFPFPTSPNPPNTPRFVRVDQAIVSRNATFVGPTPIDECLEKEGRGLKSHVPTWLVLPSVKMYQG